MIEKSMGPDAHVVRNGAPLLKLGVVVIGLSLCEVYMFRVKNGFWYRDQDLAQPAGDLVLFASKKKGVIGSYV